MKKARSDSLYAELTPQRREELTTLLHNGASYSEAKAHCAKQWQITTSRAALCDFYSASLSRFQLETFELAKAVAARAPDGGVMDKGLAAITRQKLFEGVLQIKDPRLLITLRKMEIALEAQETQRQKLKTKTELGLDALQKDIKGNPKALGLFQQLKEALKKK